MPRAWECSEGHGSFLQDGLDALARDNPGLLPAHRYACPVCCARGQSGWVHAASQTDAARLAAPQEN